MKRIPKLLIPALLLAVCLHLVISSRPDSIFHSGQDAELDSPLVSQL